MAVGTRKDWIASEFAWSYSRLAGLDYRIVRFCIFNIIWRGIWTFMMIDSTEKALDTHTVLQHMLEICIYLAPKKMMDIEIRLHFCGQHVKIPILVKPPQIDTLLKPQ